MLLREELLFGGGSLSKGTNVKNNPKADSARKRKARVVEEEPHEQLETDKLALIEIAIRKMGQKLASDEVKASIADYIRLLELQKDFYGDQPRQVTVTWVESIETDCVPEK